MANTLGEEMRFLYTFRFAGDQQLAHEHISTLAHCISASFHPETDNWHISTLAHQHIKKYTFHLKQKQFIMEENKKPQLNIELNEDVAQGVYSNLAVITHSPSEFVVDFIRVMPGVPKARVQSRIILTPQHAKRLMKALSENISKFEAQHGKITDAVSPEQMFNLGFGGPQGQA